MFRRLLVLVLTTPALASAQDKKVETRSIVLHASAAPVPVLKYPLLPEVRDLKPGNAALLYQRAHSPEWWQTLVRDSEFGKLEWSEGKLESFPVKEAERIVKQHTAMFKEIDLAARRAHCDWEMNDRLRVDGFNLLIPDVQGFRDYGRLLGIRSRRALTEKNYVEAAQSLQSGFALGQHVGEGPTLINFLVGTAIAYMTMTPVEDWVQIPGSPNLYWSLTNLPAPLISIRRPLQGERIIIESMFPGAREVLNDPTKSMPQPVGSLTRHLKPLHQIGQTLEVDIAKGFLAEAWITLKLQKEARVLLIDRGRTPAQVDALGQAQTILLYLVAQYERAFDDFAKSSSLPFWQAYPAMLQADEDLKAESVQRPEAMMLPRLLLPAIKHVLIGQARIDRRIALLRSFEAIRLHAAANKGQLLEKWDDLRGIPVPLDPATGQPFDYRREGDQAILNVPALPVRQDTAMRYAISLAK